MTTHAKVQDEKEMRNRLIAKTEVAKAQLGLDEATFRKALVTATNKNSRANMTNAELVKVVEHFKRNGWKPKSTKHQKPKVGNDKAALVDKIEALLADAGRPWEYLTKKTESLKVKNATRPMSLLERITGKEDKDDEARTIGKERLEFCTPRDLRKIVAALTYDQQRRAKRQEAA